MKEIVLKRGNVYKVETYIECYKRSYILFSPKYDISSYIQINTYLDVECVFAVLLNGKFRLGGAIGIHPSNFVHEPNIVDYLEIMMYCRQHKLKFSCKNKKLLNEEK